MTNVYVGDTPIIRLNTNTSLAGASSCSILVLKPDEVTEDTWTGASYSSTYIQYSCASGDLDQEGAYILQAYVVDGSSAWHGDAVILVVNATYDLG